MVYSMVYYGILSYSMVEYNMVCYNLNVGISHSGSQAQYKEDVRNHGL